MPCTAIPPRSRCDRHEHRAGPARPHRRPTRAPWRAHRRRGPCPRHPQGQAREGRRPRGGARRAHARRRGAKRARFFLIRETRTHRYASLFFIVGVDQDGENELGILEFIHALVETLDKYFESVCELDIIFNFHKAYHILDELLITGELQEPSKKAILRVTAAQDALMEGSGDSKVSDSKYEL